MSVLNSRKLLSCAVLLAAVSATSALAEVKLPAVYADHMVVQREVAVVVHGSANPGEAVSVTFRGATAKTVADKFGKWQVGLPPGAAGGPFTMEVVGTNTDYFFRRSGGRCMGGFRVSPIWSSQCSARSTPRRN